MNKTRIGGIFLFILALAILLLKNSPITGNFVGGKSSFSLLNFLAITLLIGALFLLVASKRTIDKLVIPGGEDDWKAGRLDRALKEKKSGRKIKKMYWLKGKDSEEDILLLGGIVKPGERVAFDTFPLHYREYKELIKKAQEDGKFPHGVKTENLATEQGLKEYIYGTVGLMEEKIKRRPLAYKRNRNEKYLEKIKELAHKFI